MKNGSCLQDLIDGSNTWDANPTQQGLLISDTPTVTKTKKPHPLMQLLQQAQNGNNNPQLG